MEIGKLRLRTHEDEFMQNYVSNDRQLCHSETTLRFWYKNVIQNKIRDQLEENDFFLFPSLTIAQNFRGKHTVAR